LVVNVLGSFVLGAVMTLSLERGAIRPELRIMLAAGFCGGFTTMSTFSYETLLLVQNGGIWSALLNIALTLVACLGAVWMGALVVRAF
jgi:CrcB protein